MMLVSNLNISLSCHGSKGDYTTKKYKANEQSLPICLVFLCDLKHLMFICLVLLENSDIYMLIWFYFFVVPELLMLMCLVFLCSLVIYLIIAL